MVIGLVFLLAGPAVASRAYPPPSAGPAGQDVPMPYGRVAVLAVGWNKYDGCKPLFFDDLAAAVNDAKSVAEVFRSHYGYDVELLADPTKEQFLAKLDQVTASLGASDVFILYLAGHGDTLEITVNNVPDRVGYIIPGSAQLTKVHDQARDAKLAELEAAVKDQAKHGDAQAPKLDESKKQVTEGKNDQQGGDGNAGKGDYAAKKAAEKAKAREDREREALAYGMSVARATSTYEAECIPVMALRDRVVKLPCKHVVLLLDTCYSGMALGDRGGPAATRINKYVDLDYYRLLGKPSKFVITAGTGRQKVYEADGHGIFSRELLGLLSDRTTPINIVTLFDQVRLRVVKALPPAWSMTPSMRQFPGDGEFVFIPKPQDQWRQLVAQAVYEDNEKALVKRRDYVVSRSMQDARVQTTSDLLIAANETTRQHTPEQAAALRDSRRWREWFDRTKAKADAGDPDAMAGMYYAYKAGLGVEKNEQEAYKWALEARNTGAPVGKALLSDAFKAGVGVNADQMLAEEQAREAKAGGVAAGSAVVLAASASQGSPEGFLAGLIGAVASVAELSDSPKKAALRLVDARRQLEAAAAMPDGPGRKDRVIDAALKVSGSADSAKKYAETMQENTLFKQLTPRFAASLNASADKLRKDVASGRDVTESIDAIREQCDLIFAVYVQSYPPEKEQKK